MTAERGFWRAKLAASPRSPPTAATLREFLTVSAAMSRRAAPTARLMPMNLAWRMTPTSARFDRLIPASPTERMAT